MIRYLSIVSLLFIFLSSCEDSSSIGNTIVEGEKFDVEYSNDFDMSAEVVQFDSLLTFIRGINYSVYSVGSINDPVFGAKTSDGFFRMGFNNSVTIPSFEGATLDSMVLILTYDTLGYYGSATVTHNLEVYGLTEDLKDQDSIYIDQEIGFDPMLIGEKSFVARPTDSITILNHADTTEVTLPAQIRIRMDDDWANDLFSDSMIYESETTLEEKFKGIYLKNTSEALLGLNFSTTSNGEGGFNRLAVYYTDSTDMKRLYTFRFFTERGLYITTDKTGSIAESVFNNDISPDSITMVESHEGYDTKIIFNDLSFLEDKIINHAELIVTVASLPEDIASNHLPVDILLSYETKDGSNRGTIQDIEDLNLLNTSLDFGYGGRIEEVDGMNIHRLIITKHIKEIIAGEVEPSIILRPFLRNQLPNRSVLYGPKHSQFGVKLGVAYTNQ